MLPGVKITINSGGIGSIPHTDDGVAGLLIPVVDPSTSGGIYPFETAVQVFSLTDAEGQGFVSTMPNADETYLQIKQFYEQAGEGAELWIYGYNTTKTLDQVLASGGDAEKLISAANGRIRLLGVIGDLPAGDIATGLTNVLGLAQGVADASAVKMWPLRILLGTGLGTDTSIYPDLHQSSAGNCGVVVSGVESTTTSVGLTVGHLSGLPVQRNIGRVKDGPVTTSADVYLGGTTVKMQDIQDKWEFLHNNGYIFLRTYVGKSGWYFNDDPVATAETDDINSISRGRVVDKVMLLAYQTYIEEVNDEVPINADGTISTSYVKALQAKIENVLNETMTLKGEISGAKAYIDPAQNILATNELNINLSILPVGQAKYINITLGLTNVLNS